MSRIYVVAISHLDTQWRWTVRETIERHLPKTLRQCFDRFARYPGWVLSFDGAFRYRLIEEYYPEDFARLGEWVRRGRWGIAGAWLDAADVNLPSPESLVRQALYGVRYFSRRFGVRPRDVFLPDCFGFGWALPSIAAHCGLVGFSSQKLSKGRAAEPIPFALGRWVGADGAEIVAALEPGGYGEPLVMPPNGEPVGLRYFGVGDTGGAPDEGSLRRLEAALAAPVPDVRAGPAGRLFAELEPREIAALPRYSGELLLNLHGSGCYTSRAAMKRWNRRNQVLARSAEAACAAADWLGGLAYPTVELRRAWERFLWHQFHDDLTGTSVPEAYEISENDERLSANQFARLLEAAVGVIARGLDTRGQGDPLVVWNPLELARREIVEAEVVRRDGRPRVFDGSDEVPAQLVDTGPALARIAFLADVPATGCAVFHIRWDEATAPPEGAAFPAVEIDGEGRLARIPGGLLRRPVELELLADTSWRFPSWEIRREDLGAPARERVAGPATMRPTETGPARLAWAVRRTVGRSTFVDTVRVAAGGDLVEVESTIDWHARGRLLKLSVAAALEAPVARYDLGLGAIERGANSDRLWEVPAQSWADLSSADGAHGLSIFTDCKHGWDRPEPGTLRLTLLHTPRVGRRFRHQGRQDLGHHRHRWALWPHGRASLGEIARRAARFEHPLVAFRALPHSGALGRRFSFCELEGDGESLLMALKKTEDADRLLVRLRETAGRPAPGRLRFAAPVVGASETNGVEETADAGASQASQASDTPQVEAGGLTFALGRFQPRSALVTLRPPPAPVAPIASSAVRLPPGDPAATWNRDRRAADFDGRGRSYPAELLPERLIVDGVAFELSGRLALACRGQSIALPPGGEVRLHVLAAAACDDSVEAEVRWEAGASRVTVPSWTGIAADLRPTVAWVGTHRHRRRGDDAYHFCYLWRLALEIPPGAGAVRLPDDERIRLFAAATFTDPSGGIERASDLYDGGKGPCPG